MLSEEIDFGQIRVSNGTFHVEECDLGLGVFADRDIEPGEIIYVFGGSIIDFPETKRRGNRECMPIQIGANKYIDTLAPGIYVNHSCQPNAGIHNDRDLIALYKILKGEEIRFDYSTTMQEASFTMECRCGKHNCRGIVDDFLTLPNEVQTEYLRHKIVMQFIVDGLSSTNLSTV
jgi:hypothetical protein